MGWEIVGRKPGRGGRWIVGISLDQARAHCFYSHSLQGTDVLLPVIKDNL